MRRRVGVLLFLLVATPAGARQPDPPPGPPLPETERFASLLRRLEDLGSARVSSACGAAVAPWAYRGDSFRETILRPIITDRANRDWSRRFVAALLREADWDSVLGCRANSRPCGDRRLAPIFTVTLRAGGENVYVTLHFDGRCAQVFQASRPMGTVHFEARADSLFALLREGLPSDRDVQALAGPPPREEPTTPALTVPDSSGLELPHVLSKVPPDYPEQARQNNVQGTVWIQALIGADGAVKDAFVRSSTRGLDGAALDAIWRWGFQSARRNGRPVAVWILVPIRFTLR